MLRAQSLCQINKSVEVDYYKVRCNGEYRIIIPQNFSKATSDYLDEVTKRYTFSERGGFIMYDELQLFDMRESQPEINLFKVRLDSATSVASMVKYIEISNAFRAADSDQQYLVFIADNALMVEVSDAGGVTILINKIVVEVATIFFNKAVSFVPCFKYADSADVILFASPNIHYLVDSGGQFCTDYYGMKHELIVRHCLHLVCSTAFVAKTVPFLAVAAGVHKVGRVLRRPQRRARLQRVRAQGAAHRVKDRAVRPGLPAAGPE